MKAMASILVACAMLAAGCSGESRLRSDFKVPPNSNPGLAHFYDEQPISDEELKNDWVQIDNMTIARFDESGNAIEVNAVIMPSPETQSKADVIIVGRLEAYRKRKAQELELDPSK